MLSENRIQGIIKSAAAATAAKSLQSCLTLCDPINGSPPGSPIPGILGAKILEWVAISSSNAWKWEVKVKSLSRVWLLATPRTAAYQAPPSMGFSRQEYWSGVPLPSPHKVWIGIILFFSIHNVYNQIKYIKHKYTQTQIYRYQNLFGVFNINIRASKVTECLYYLI